MKSPLVFVILFCLLAASIHFTAAVLVEGKQYALIIADDRFVNEGNLIYEVLVDHYDFHEIIYLHGSNATKTNVRNAIASLNNTTTIYDFVFIYIATHGGGLLLKPMFVDGRLEDYPGSDEGPEVSDAMLYGSGGNASKWYGIDESIKLYGSGTEELYWDDELRDDLINLICWRLAFVYTGCQVENETCFGGGFIDDLTGQNRIIMTNANETSPALTDLTWNGSYWSKHFISAFDVGTSAFEEADINSDHDVSFKEAFDYAWNKDPKRISGDETPWFDDDGDGGPTFVRGEDYLDNDQGSLASDTYLSNNLVFSVYLSGDINDDGYVNYLDGILLGAAYGSTPNDPNWNPDADLNEDGYINYLDAIILGSNYGQSVFPSGSSSNASSSTYTLETYSYSTTLKVQPAENIFYTNQTSVGEMFTISVTAEDVSDLYGWEFMLEWTSGVINCTQETINYAVWSDYQGPWLSNPIDNANGKYHQSLTATSPAEPFTGTTWLVNLTFQITQAPPEGGIASTNLTISPAPGTSYCLADETAFEILHSFSHGTYEYISPPPERFMRGDQQTVNSLTAYVLGKNQSSTAQLQSIDDYGSNTAYWGIRVWKRSVAGVETEITSGTPVAQVSRNTKGHGIQTATWNCPGISLTQTDTIIVRVYCKNGGSWTLIATFTTEQLNTTALQEATWTVYYWTQRDYVRTEEGWMTIADYRWGTTAYNSHIQNLLTQ